MSIQEGDYVANNYQYEFRDFLFGSGTKYIATKVKGLLGRSDINSSDTELIHEHGSAPGLPTYKKRIITFDIAIDSHADDIEADLAAVEKAFQLPRRRNFQKMNRLVFRRDGISKFVGARVDKVDIESDYRLARGFGEVAVQFVALDPIKYSLIQNSHQIVAAAGVASVNGDVVNIGDLADGARPVVTIQGPATNPRLTNTTDDNRAFRWDGIITAAQTLTVDFGKRTVTLAGADSYTGVRTDNQWWELLPGRNRIVYDRDAGNAGASSTVTLTFRPTYA